MRRLMIIMLCLMLVACTPGKEDFQYDEANLASLSVNGINAWVTQDAELFYNAFSPNMKKAVAKDSMPLLYSQVFGDLKDLDDVVIKSIEYQGDYAVVLAEVIFGNGHVVLVLTYTQDYQLEGLFVQEFEVDQTLRQNEKEVLIGQEKPLKGNLIRSSDDNKTVVLIVAGSGPSDKDGTLGQSKVYRDLAYGLADLNIDSYRFNKRTYQYPQDMAGLSYRISVEDEILNDVNLAITMLDQMGYDNIIVLGHSLGGMLSLSIANNNEWVDGIISMAGSLRGLEEIIYDQNMAVINDTQDAKLKDDYLKNVNDEMDLFKSRANLPESTLIFGMSNYYWDSLKANTSSDQVEMLNKPILVLQGKLDEQVYYEADYGLWKERLKSKDAVMIAYDDLDHRFMKKGQSKVDPAVIQDIVKWINDTQLNKR